MMPMQSYMGANLVGPAPTGYAPDALLDDLSRQISLAHPRRYSRGSNGYGYGHHGQYVAGGARVAKPSSSASNSPRSAIMQARRRTLMNDGLLARRNQQLLEQACLPTPAPEPSFDDPMKRSARPVSWHPSSQMAMHQAFTQPQQQQQQQQSLAQYPFPSYSEVDFYTQYQRQFPPTPSAYSDYNSPIAFSPLSLPHQSFEPPRYNLSADTWTAGPVPTCTAATSPIDCPGLVGPASNSQFSEQTSSRSPQSSANTTPSDTAAQWSSFVAHGFSSTDSSKALAAPPTPDSYPTVPPPEPVIPSEESIPYQPLEDDEEEGEILIGMGLYDPPEKPLYDTGLDSYRASVGAHNLLGSSFSYPEPTGKGLKLEDAWEPPAKDEDEEDEDDDDEKSSSDDDADDDEAKEA